jgi:hypothetical protein
VKDQRTAVIKRIHVFKAGEQTSSAGVSKTFTPEILKEVAETYDPGSHEAPLVIGHAGDNDSLPSFGWVKKLEAEGEDLFAEIDFSDVAAELVKNKHYKKVSISLYPPENKISPHPGRWNVRHVALLGASPPAIKGLEPFKFAEQGESLEFSTKLTLDQVIDEDLGPSLDVEEGPLEILKEKLEEARSEKAAEAKKETSKAEEISEEQEEQKTTQSKAADDESAAVSPDSNSQFTEMPKELEEKIIESPEDSVNTEESPVTPAEPEEAVVDHSESEEDKEDEKRKKEEEEGENREEGDSSEGEEDKEEEEDRKKKKSSEPASDMAETVEEEKEEAEPLEEMSEGTVTDPMAEILAELEQLKAEKQALEQEYRESVVRTRKEKLQGQVSSLFNSGKLTEAIVSPEELTGFCEGLEFGTLEFSEGETAATRLIDFLNKLPAMVEFGEVVSEVKTEEMKFAEMGLHERTLHLSSKEGIPYEAALKKAVAMGISG